MTSATLLATHSAQAACPGVFSTEDCNNGYGSDDVCTQVSSTQWSCALDTNLGMSTAVDAWGKFLSPSSTEFRAYGEDALGEKFCCEFTVADGCSSGTYNTVVIDGSPAADTIELRDPVAGYELECTDVEVFGGDEADIIAGSDSTDNNDTLHGNTGADTLRGMSGADVLWGGLGPDTLFGVRGDDEIYGRENPTYPSWGSDDSSRDLVQGGGGDDYIKGGGGDDWLCGGDHSDEIYGETGDDILHGQAGTEVELDGGAGYDKCEDDNHVNCEDIPVQAWSCPW